MHMLFLVNCIVVHFMLLSISTNMGSVTSSAANSNRSRGVLKFIRKISLGNVSLLYCYPENVCGLVLDSSISAKHSSQQYFPSSS